MVLLIDDDLWIRDAFSVYFQTKGCVLLALENTARGLAALSAGRFDIVICNQNPPQMDGLEFLLLVSRLQPESIRVLLTISPPASWTNSPGRDAIHDILQKPITAEDIERSLGRHIALRGASGKRSMADEPSGEGEPQLHGGTH
jgi:two-component system response regulator PfeR